MANCKFHLNRSSNSRKQLEMQCISQYSDSGLISTDVLIAKQQAEVNNIEL